MKKVLSVALASSMVLGMGLNAFALEYNTGANDVANWPTNFKFDGSLFVTDEDDNFVQTSTASLGSKSAADFKVGDTIWMPLYADDQSEWVVNGTTGGYPAIAERTLSYNAILSASTNNDLQIRDNGSGQIEVVPFVYRDVDNRTLFHYGYNSLDLAAWVKSNGYEDYRQVAITNTWVTVNNVTKTAMVDVLDAGQATSEAAYVNVLFHKNGSGQIVWRDNAGNHGGVITAGTVLNASNVAAAPNYYFADGTTATAPTFTAISASSIAFVEQESAKYGNNTDFEAYIPVGTAQKSLGNTLRSGVKVNFRTPAVSRIDATDGSISQVGNQEVTNQNLATKKYGHYTGKIDKNWSINLLERTKGAEEVIDSAEFYRADVSDVAKYGKYTNQIKANAVYVKVNLKDFFDSVSDATLKYYVYVANNNGNTSAKTNEVWVEGKYANNKVNYVNFDWSNSANSPAVWSVRKGENGTAVFDFQDKVFFTVKMYSEEKMYLDLSTAYDKVVAGDFSEADFDSFFKFAGTNANFSREGQLLLSSNDADLFVYEIDEDGNLVPVDAEYVKNYKIAHTNTKANGYLFNTKQLGNYVLSVDELEAEDEEPVDEDYEEPADNEPEAPTVDETPSEVPTTPSKPNPETGADDFVGVAVALAVVSVAAAGALALKK